MITLCLILAIIAFLAFGLVMVVLFGGVTGLAIACDVIVAVLIIGLIVKLITGH